jgi:hypothetical protein
MSLDAVPLWAFFAGVIAIVMVSLEGCERRLRRPAPGRFKKPAPEVVRVMLTGRRPVVCVVFAACETLPRSRAAAAARSDFSGESGFSPLFCATLR